MKVTEDASLPGLKTAFDIVKMKDIIRDLLRKDYPDITLVDGKIAFVKYDPKKCVLLYQFRLENSVTNRRHRQLITARVLKEGESLPVEPSSEEYRRYEKNEKLWIRSPMILLPRHKIALYPFPEDMELTWLNEAVDRRSMKKYFNRMWKYSDLKARKVKVELLKYTPLVRASFLYKVFVEERKTGKRDWQYMIGKTNVFKKPDELFAGVWALWQASEGKVGFPRPVGFMPRPSLTLQERVAGERLGSLIESSSFEEIIRETARSIARFHSIAAPLSTTRTLKHQLNSVKRWTSALIQIRPDMEKRISAFGGNILREIESRMRIVAPIHGDFHHTNVLVDDKKVSIIDLDEMGYGDPCVDVGRFLTALSLPSLRAFGNINHIDNYRENFLEEYLKVRDEDVRNIRLFESASFLLTAYTTFRIQRPDWKNEVNLLIDEGERIFETAKKKTVFSVSGKGSKASSIIIADRLRWALDGTYIQTILTQDLHKLYGVEAAGCRVLSKDEKSCGHLVRYRVMGWLNNKKWKSKIDGITFTDGRRNSFFRLYTQLYHALKETEAKRLLPRPIGYSLKIKTLFIEKAKGRRFSSLIGKKTVTTAAAILARALFAMHTADIKSEETHSFNQEVKEILSRIGLLENDFPEFHMKAGYILSVIEKDLVSQAHKISPVLFRLRPKYVLCQGSHVTVTDITGLKHSHPYLDVGNYIAQILLYGVNNGCEEESRKVADYFSNSYSEVSGASENDFIPFISCALIRVASSVLKKNHQKSIPLKLLNYAEKHFDK